jgi:hypothetical protein
MRVLLINRGKYLDVQTFFPMGGAFPTGIQVPIGEAVLVEVKPGEVKELERVEIPEE